MDNEHRIEGRMTQEVALDRAQAAVVIGDPRAMVEALYESGYLDGLTRSMHRRWDRLPVEDIELIVAEAVGVLYEAVSQGKRVLNIKSYLWKVADNLANKLHETKVLEDAIPDDLEDPTTTSQRPDDEGDPYDEIEPEERVRMAVVIARSLLHKLGERNIRNVMEYIFDAVEAGRDDVTTEEICEALGYPNRGTVRVWIQRGFDRLANRAYEEGVVDRRLDLTALRQKYDIRPTDNTKE
jgi:DNA-directed RNA polymerase specialized sigma24 family protein